MFTSISRFAYGFEDNVYRFVTAASPRAYRVACSFVVIVAIVFSAILFATGASHQRMYPVDHAFLLDGGYKMMSGLRPHTDFVTHQGIVTYLPVVLGMMIGGINVASLAYGPAALLPVLAAVAFYFARNRFSAFMAAMIAIMVGGLTIGTYPLGGVWNIPTYAMQYNRFGWSLHSILVFVVLVQPRCPISSWGRFWEGACSGLIVGLLILFKPNYAAAAVAISLVGLIVLRHGKFFWLGCFAALLGVLAIYAAYMNGNVFAYVLAMAGRFASMGPTAPPQASSPNRCFRSLGSADAIVRCLVVFAGCVFSKSVVEIHNAMAHVCDPCVLLRRDWNRNNGWKFTNVQHSMHRLGGCHHC